MWFALRCCGMFVVLVCFGVLRVVVVCCVHVVVMWFVVFVVCGLFGCGLVLFIFVSFCVVVLRFVFVSLCCLCVFAVCLWCGVCACGVGVA